MQFASENEHIECDTFVKSEETTEEKAQDEQNP